MYKSVLAAALSVLFVTAPVAAQDKAPGRYTMTPTADGMLRLDTQTGAVSQCTRKADKWVCRSVPDDRLALESEIDRLSEENRRLRADRPPEDPERWLPSDTQVDEFMAFFEKMMRRFKGMVESLQEDKPHKQL